MPRLVALALLFACTPSTPPPEPPPRPAEAKPVEPPAKAEPVDRDGQWRCQKDADCVSTCELGAVSGEWLAKHPDASSCDDGCDWTLVRGGRMACQNGSCVALDAQGEIAQDCTRRPFEPEK